MARLLGITRFWNYISDWIECRVHLRPEKDNTIDLGSRDYRWRTIYTGTAIGARVYNNAALTIPDATWTALTFNSERFDTDGIHSTTTNTGRLTCQTAGVYAVVAHVQFAANVTGIRMVQIQRNGTRVALDTRNAVANASYPTTVSLSTCVALTAGQYLEVLVLQNRGGNLNVDASAESTPEFAMVRIA